MITFLRILTPLMVLVLGTGHWYLIGYPETSISKPEREYRQISVDPLPLSVHCPGSFIQVGGPSGTDLGLVERLGQAEISWTNSVALDLSPEPSTAGFESAIASGSEQSTRLVSMIQVQAVNQERARGIQASFCPKAASSGWLPNGFSIAGGESVLLIANPSLVEALVEIEIHLPQRVVNERVALAPQGEQMFSLARYANGEELFAIRFETNGPEVLVSMQNRLTSGLTPAGIELAVAGAFPSRSHEFVGLRELTGGFTLPELRVYNASENATEVVVTALDGQNVEIFRIQVPASGFGKVDLEVSDNFQLMKLESPEPVLAAIRSTTINPILDFAWIQPAERFRSLNLPLTEFQNTLVLANPEARAVELTITKLDGERVSVQTLVLPALGTTSVQLSGDSVSIGSEGEFLAALELLDPAGYSVISPRENANLGNDLRILTR